MEYTLEDIIEYMLKDEEWDIPEEEKKRFVESIVGRLLHA